MRHLARNSLVLIASNVLGAALGFALSLVIGRGLGEADFGRWAFCFAWAGALGMICEFGLNSLFIREAARAPAESNQLLVSSLTAQVIFVGMLGLGVWIFAPTLSLDAETSSALRVSVLIALAGILYGSFTAAFRSIEWMGPILWLNILGLTAQLIWSLWVIHSGGTLLQLIWVAVIVDAAQLLGAFMLWMIRIKPRGGLMRLSWRTASAMTRGAIPFAVAGAFAAIQMRSNVMMIGYLRDASEVGWFAAALRWSEAAKLIPNGIFGALYPAFARKEGADYFRRVNPILQMLALGLALLLCVFARPILSLSFGAQYLQSVPILFWLGVGILPSLWNGSIETYLYAAGAETYATRLRGVAVVVQVLSGIVLIYFYGAVGAAVSILLGEMSIFFALQRQTRMMMRGDVPDAVKNQNNQQRIFANWFGKSAPIREIRGEKDSEQ